MKIPAPEGNPAELCVSAHEERVGRLERELGRVLVEQTPKSLRRMGHG